MHWTRLLLALPLFACTADPADDAIADADRAAASLSAKEALGQRLFTDAELSEPRGESCASCHDPKRGFAGDAKSKIDGVAAGAVKGVVGTRNTPTAMYALYTPPFHFEGATPVGGQFWDGRADTLADQAKLPLLNPREMNNPSAAAVVAKVRAAKYAADFRAVYGDAIFADDARAFDAIADAIAAFEETAAFRPFASDFDAYLRGERALTPAQARGFALFQDPQKGNCIACHAGDPTSKDPHDWLFTDHTYDTLGVPRNRAIPDNADPQHFDLGLCQAPGFADRVPEGVDPTSLCGAFKVPTLRNVAITGPYFHDGELADLRDVVTFYVTRDTDPARWYPGGTPYDDLPAAYTANVNRDEVPYDRAAGQPPRLAPDEIDDVVAFLEALTDRERGDTVR